MLKEISKVSPEKASFDFTRLPKFQQAIPAVLQFILNVSLILLAVVLCVLLGKEIFNFVEFIMLSEVKEFQYFLEKILVFFLYFEFITMIVKYFRENYHFPLRYFLYIGITAMIRLIIVDHHDPMNTLLYAFVILTLILSYYIINKTPRERP
ncbi:phosphate-starvation-inducible protein PsiE [Bacillus taeanensis]|uniref:phosphate-starvation-inducible protein PsiE n=1 Tax=Bacillus taeanensis TaxID=273032 RepID=UPI00248261BE|nr:phosphate-starvation-inducible protein PsiE [Bacillus taeanensis]